MLPRSQRLNLKKSFSWVRAGRKTEGKLVKIFTRFGNNEGALVAVSVSKSVSAKATERNQVKRRTFISLEKLIGRLPQGLNVVVMPKAEAREGLQEEFDEEINGLLKDEISSH